MQRKNYFHIAFSAILISCNSLCGSGQSASFVTNPENANNFKTDQELDNLKGRIKSLRQTAECADTSKNWFCLGKEHFSTYNDKGNIILYQVPSDSDVITYNSLGQKIERKSVEVKTSATVYKELYNYDEKGNRTEKIFTDLKTGVKRAYKYNTKGDEIEGQDFKPDGSTNSKWTVTYIYNKSGVKTSVTRVATSAKSSDTLEWKYKYDAENNNTECSNYHNGYLTAKEIYKYDKQHRQITGVDYNGKGFIDINVAWKYDNHGNRIEEDHYKPDGTFDSKYTAKYQYDSTGNWIKMTELLDSKITCIVTRQIEYYR